MPNTATKGSQNFSPTLHKFVKECSRYSLTFKSIAAHSSNFGQILYWHIKSFPISQLVEDLWQQQVSSRTLVLQVLRASILSFCLKLPKADCSKFHISPFYGCFCQHHPRSKDNLSSICDTSFAAFSAYPCSQTLMPFNALIPFCDQRASCNLKLSLDRKFIKEP